MSDIDHKKERQGDVEKIVNSKSLHKVVVAGPGTGKSFLFQELIKDKKTKGKTDFVAITFIGKLGDALADDLCGLAKTMTMHGFARELVLKHCKGWTYYPHIYQIIKEDLEKEGVTEFQVGDDRYRERSAHYKAIGDADVVYYAVQICKKDPNKIPQHDLILIDEFQDFNGLEAEFVDYLCQKNEVVIVGDDDQALYEFKGSSPSFIREKHHSDNTEFESHTLRFCSRCTDVIIKYFHAIVEKYNLNNPGNGRVQKEYICYVPDKKKDSDANPNIHLIKGCPDGMIATKIKSELEDIVKTQKIKEVLIIGEARSCKAILTRAAAQLRTYGFENVTYKSENELIGIDQDKINAYKLLFKDSNSVLGWRILQNPDETAEKERHIRNAKTLNVLVTGTPSKIGQLGVKNFEALQEEVVAVFLDEKDLRKKIFVKEIKEKNVFLSRPLGNLNITVCNILNSKGLGADVVFVVGFDKGKFPAADQPTHSEIYQMLVALTRAKKRIYLINTINNTVSGFIECLDKRDLSLEEIKIRN